VRLSTDADSDVTSRIAADFPTLTLAIDCITENGTTYQCAQSIASKKGHVVALLPLDDERLTEFPEIKTETTLVYTVLGKAFHWWNDWPVMEDDKRMIEEWLVLFSRTRRFDLANTDLVFRFDRLAVDMPKLMASGQIKSNPLLRREGGLEQVNEGMNFQKAGKVSPFCSLSSVFAVYANGHTSLRLELCPKACLPLSLIYPSPFVYILTSFASVTLSQSYLVFFASGFSSREIALDPKR